MSEVPIAEWLKIESRNDHDEVEIAMQSNALLAPELEKTVYIRHLRALWGAYTKVQFILQPFSEDPLIHDFKPIVCNDELLEKDLNDLNVNYKSENINVEPCSHLYMAYGILYVALGSNLGRSMIAKQIQSQVLNWHKKGPFYFIIDPKRTRFWPGFLSRLNSLDLEPKEREEVLKGAQLAYRLFIKEANAVAGQEQ